MSFAARHRTMLENRIHAVLIAFGHPCPVSDLFGHSGPELPDRMQIPGPWRGNIDVSWPLVSGGFRVTISSPSLWRCGRRGRLSRVVA
jgi:hypothetical protein